MPKQPPNTKRTLLADSAAIFLIRFFPALAALLAMVLLSRHLPPALYGQYQRFWVQWQVLNAIVCLGLPALLLTLPLERIHAFFRAAGTRRKALFACWMLAGALLFTALQADAHFLLPWIAGGFLLLNVPVAILEAYLMNAGRYGAVALGSALYALTFAILHILLVRNSIGFPVLFAGLAGASLLRLLVLAPAVFRRQRNSGKAVEAAGVRSLWLHLGLYDVIQVLFRWADKFILPLFLPPALFAVYFNGTVDIPFLSLLLGAVGSALLLHLGREQPTDEDRIALLRRSSARLAQVVFPLFFLLILFRQELFAVVFRNRYQAAVPLFLISSLVIPLRAYNFTSVLQHEGRGRVINAGALLDLGLALALMYPLYLLWQLNGVALAFVLSTYVQAGFYLWHTARLLHCPVYRLLPLGAWLRTGAISLLLFFTAHRLCIRYFDPLRTLILGSVLMSLIVIVLLLSRFRRR